MKFTIFSAALSVNLGGTLRLKKKNAAGAEKNNPRSSAEV